ncbi:DCC1-like thiol-disulfide oxidoreductase family protein [Sphingomonas sp. TDK1]|uniref:DCC1-like thiol-disulfide oxidoreductase family protein n=1 Tax=Sphingomonas sp. TDK1 TaxID=453247 RepID=UPI0007DA3530|nr:DCC1-like thiol-disulfide oxidoreductase family protein [Sphingomonas sp. TDK1]OAN60100.1 thiol-disulfide oxidoreductase [Sphingomonas sp. TDK1]
MADLLTVWYDGGCPLCVREIALMRRLDRRGRLRFVDVSDDTNSCPLDRGDLLARFHVSDAQGRFFNGAAAFAAMWRVIPLLRPFGLLALLPGMTWALERLYRAFLRVRPTLQRWMRERERHGGR